MSLRGTRKTRSKIWDTFNSRNFTIAWAKDHRLEGRLEKGEGEKKR